MKKLFYLFIFTFIFVNSLCVDVSAKEYQQWELIPVDTVGSVTTEKFYYNEFYYNSSKDVKGYTSIVFNYVKNLSKNRMPISISVGLFDENKKNIGMINYCSSYDLDSSYSDIVLNASASSPFVIYIKPDKYTDKKHSLDDVKFISVIKDNKYCKVGGATNYIGLTVEEMKNGDNNQQVELDENARVTQDVMKIAVIVLAIIIIYMTFASIMSTLYMKMYNVWTFASYIPFVNFYLCYKMAFGPLLSKVFIGILLGGLFLMVIGNNILLYVGCALLFVSLLLDIFKLITKKYEILYYDPNAYLKKEERPHFSMTDSRRTKEIMMGISSEQVLEDDYVPVTSDTVEEQPIGLKEIDMSSEINKINSNDEVISDYFSNNVDMNNDDDEDDYIMPTIVTNTENNLFDSSEDNNDAESGFDNMFNNVNIESTVNDFSNTNSISDISDSIMDIFNTSSNSTDDLSEKSNNKNDDSDEGDSDLTKFFS